MRLIQGLVELGMASSDPLQASPMVDLLLKLLQAWLSHGLLAHARSLQHSWSAMLPLWQSSTFDALLVSLTSK